MGLAVTVAWLRSAFSDIAFDEIERITDGDIVISRVMFSARQTGPLVLFEGGRAARCSRRPGARSEWSRSTATSCEAAR